LVPTRVVSEDPTKLLPLPCYYITKPMHCSSR